MSEINARFVTETEAVLNQLDLKQNQFIVVAVSCGVDSSSLLNVLEKLKEQYQYNIVIAHVNHGKRKQSEIEEQYICSYAKEKKMAIEVLRLNGNDFSGSNFQEEARNIRIQFFKRIMEQYQTSYLFLAHHFDDDTETMLMHLMRNSSLDALCGLKKIVKYQNVYFIRPFLVFTKQEIYEYAQNNKIQYFEDVTNQENHYTRNQVRHLLLKDTFGQIDYYLAILEYKKKIIEVKDILNEKRDYFISHYVKKEENPIRVQFSLLDFKCEQIDTQKDILFELLKEIHPDLGMNNINEILKIFKANGNKFIKTKNILIKKAYNDVCFEKLDNNTSINEAKNKPFLQDCDIIQKENNQNEIRINEFGKTWIDTIHWIDVKPIDKNLKINVLNKDIICYNVSMLPIIVRSIQPGDRIKIKDGSKKVNDLLKDLKVPLETREKMKVLLDKDGNILSVLGLRKSYLLNEMENVGLEKDLMIQTNYYQNF